MRSFLISVITITFNNYEELIETLDSIKDVPNIESIVINGGSCEKTKTFLLSYPGKSISEKDNGISDAFNKGIKLSTGLGIMFLNSGDILIDKNYLADVEKVFSDNSLISYVHSDILYDDAILGPIHIKSTTKPRSLAKGMPYPHQSLIVRRNVFDQVGYFKEKYKLVMDYDFVLRMYKINAKGFHIPRMTVRMDGAGVSSRSDLKILKENYAALKENDYLSFPIKVRLLFSRLIFCVKKFLVKIHCTPALKLIKRIGRKVHW